MGEKITRQAVLRQLNAACDLDYRAFNCRILPGTENILGVRTPVLRRLAKKLLKEDWESYIELLKQAEKTGENPPLFYEEKLLWALCIGGSRKKFEMAEPLIREFIPQIDNWAVCDLFCGSLEMAGKAPKQSWTFIQPFFQSEKEYEVRFAMVMLLSYFVDKEHLEEAFFQFDQFSHEGYYAKMAAAWALSLYFVSFPEEVFSYLERSRLDDWTYNKSIQKMTESLRVSKETKDRLRAMKRKKITSKKVTPGT